MAAQPVPPAESAPAAPSRPQMGRRVRLQLLQPHALCRLGEWRGQLLRQLPCAGQPSMLVSAFLGILSEGLQLDAVSLKTAR